MFILRIIEEVSGNENAKIEQVENNHFLGKSYSKLKNGTSQFDDELEKWQQNLDVFWPDLNVKKDVDLFICGENGDSYFVLKSSPLKKYSYFIMSENGQTFERL